MVRTMLTIGVLSLILAEPHVQGDALGEAPPADTSPLVHEAIIKAPPAEVWKVWSTPEGFKLLGVAKCDMDFRVGGLIRSSYSADADLGSEKAIHNRIIAYEPERMVAFRIAQPPKGFPFQEAYKSTWSVVTLTDLGDGRTHLRLAGMGYTADSESQKMRKFFETGNDWSLKKLQSHFDAQVQPGAPGTAHAEQPLAPIEVEALVPAAREDVYVAYSTSEGWKAFFGVESSIEARPGGPFEIYMKPDGPPGRRGSEGCTVLALVPGEMFSYTWNAPSSLPWAREQRTWVVVTFEPVSAALTRVRVRHLGFAELAAGHPDHAEELRQARADFSQAWPKVLAALRDHFLRK